MRVLISIALVLVFSRAARADDSKNTVTYAGIDASTVRVFAVGTVGVTTIRHFNLDIELAATQAGHGTGFAVEPDLIITAQHVVEGARHVVVRLPGDGGFLPARVVYSNKEQDVAVLHVAAELTPIRMQRDGQTLRVRQTVFAVGYPLDATRTQAQSARGIISGHRDDSTLQLDISLNPGNSGGPLVDESDVVVGMVIARGDVAKGVQGIGIAVPVAKLATAIADARLELTTSPAKPVSAHEKMSAEVVDELVRQGTLQSANKPEDPWRGFESRQIEQEIDRIAIRLHDADLLVFVAGNLWNASRALHFGGMRKIGDNKLSEFEATTLARDLQRAAVRLTKKAREIDATVSERSSFVGIALRERAELRVTGGISPFASRWTLLASPTLRMNTEATGGWGGGLELKNQRINRTPSARQMFFNWGISAGRVSLTSQDTATLTHAFYAFEAGAGVSLRAGRSMRFELYGGIAPSYYTASAESVQGMTTSESGLVVDHFRATASLTSERWYVSSGLRLISSAMWIEPIGLGINF